MISFLIICHCGDKPAGVKCNRESGATNSAGFRAMSPGTRMADFYWQDGGIGRRTLRGVGHGIKK